MKIVIYSTTNCAACHSLTAWLAKQNCQYDLRITDTDSVIMAEFMQANEGMISVPFTVLTSESGQETKISGFDRGKFKSVLGV
jgi:glutaredoxin